VLTREVTFPTAAYSADAIQRAAYRLSDRLALELVADDAVYHCTVSLAVEGGAAADVLLADSVTRFSIRCCVSGFVARLRRVGI
jgi:hypothetical protein